MPLQLDHAVILVEKGRKTVSSSQAHLRVTTSRLFAGRPERAEARLGELQESLATDQWHRAFELCWSEFWDMHALFETSDPAFGYMRPATFEVLERLRQIWETEGDGPLVTMDAGANIHILLKPTQRSRAAAWLNGLNVLTSWDVAGE